jgi:hypothetical protein
MTGDYVECKGCGSDVYKTATTCPMCNGPVAGAEGAEGEGGEVVQAVDAARAQRPDGAPHIAAAIWFGLAAIGLSLLAVALPATIQPQYSFDAPQPNLFKYFFAWLGNGLFVLAIVLWSVGQIIKAISFVGRD